MTSLVKPLKQQNFRSKACKKDIAEDKTWWSSCATWQQHFSFQFVAPYDDKFPQLQLADAAALHLPAQPVLQPKNTTAIWNLKRVVASIKCCTLGSFEVLSKAYLFVKSLFVLELFLPLADRRQSTMRVV